MQRSWRLDWNRWGTVLLTTVLAVTSGCASPGQEQNYRELEEESPEIQPEEEDPMFGELDQIESAEAATQPGEDASAANDLAGSASDQEAAPTVERAPSLQGDDRADWDVTMFHPISGEVTHGPLYFGTRDEADVTEQVTTGSLEQRYQAALRIEEGNLPSGANLGQAVVEPVIFYTDLLLLPVRLVTTPPISQQTSP